LSNIWVGAIVVDCSDLSRMIAFWQEALHYVPRDPGGASGVVLKDPRGRGPNLSLYLTSERPLPEYRTHLDLYSTSAEREVARLVELGTPVRRPSERGHDFVTLADPDGNPFDVVDKTGCSDSAGITWLGSMVINCTDLPRMIAFWREALEYHPRYPAEADGVVLKDPDDRGPDLELNSTNEGPLRDYRHHLDLYSSEPEGQVDRLLKLGATLERPAEAGHDFVTLADPDGNMFDVIDKKGWSFGQRV
jgi:catechol 2,3-dioxygenase-like lactoylglutathione lyase family enzyme